MKIPCDSFTFQNEKKRVGDIVAGKRVEKIFRDKKEIYFESDGFVYSVKSLENKNEFIDLDNNDYFYTFDSKIPFSDGIYVKRAGKRHNFQYRHAFMTFDIESTTWTTLKEPFATMYIWQTCVCGKCFYGRTWEELYTHFSNIQRVYKLSSKNVMVCYVHNLSFEWQFIHNFFKVISEKSWANAKDKPVKILTEEGFEFRCSYILSNMNLQKFCENTKNVIHGKLKGELDYKKKRHHLTPLTIEELRYCFNDVAGLYECIQERLREEENGFFSIPLTSTGYVRRELKKKVENNISYKEAVKRLCPTMDIFDRLTYMFRGGNTHANRFYSTKFLDEVASIDISSSYPFQILFRKYPCTAFQKVKEELYEDFEFIEFCINERACIFKITAIDYKVKEDITIPYLPLSKCTKTTSKIVNDNGRILSCEMCSFYCNEIDFSIIKEQVEEETFFIIEELYTAKKDYLPVEIRELTLEFFVNKTQLKNVTGKEYEYAKSKNLLNSIYGMMVTNCVKAIIQLLQNGYFQEELTEEEREKRLKKEYDKGFLAFQWGVWVTSYARKELQEMIDIIREDVIYVDTDSVKFLNIEKHLNKINDYNNNLINEMLKLDIKPFAIRDNKKFYMGTFDIEKTSKKFKTYGAKKYISIYEDEQKRHTVKITVAGCSKEQGSNYIVEQARKKVFNYLLKQRECSYSLQESYKIKRAKKYNHISNSVVRQVDDIFKIGLIIPAEKSGRNVAYRVDSVGKQRLTDYNNVTTEEVTTSSLAMIETTYELGITNDYESLLKECECFLWG